MKVIAVNKRTTKKVIKHWCYDLRGNIKKTFCNLHGNYNSFIPCNNEYSAELNKPQRTQKKYILNPKKKRKDNHFKNKNLCSTARRRESCTLFYEIRHIYMKMRRCILSKPGTQYLMPTRCSFHSMLFHARTSSVARIQNLIIWWVFIFFFGITSLYTLHLLAY